MLSERRAAACKTTELVVLSERDMEYGASRRSGSERTRTVDNAKIDILSKVKLRIQKTHQVVTYLLVAENEADLRTGRISVDSPIGKRLLGKQVGDVAEISIPSGVMKLEILEIGR